MKRRCTGFVFRCEVRSSFEQGFDDSRTARPRGPMQRRCAVPPGWNKSGMDDRMPLVPCNIKAKAISAVDCSAPSSLA